MMGPAGSEEGGRAESWLEGTKEGKKLVIGGKTQE